MPKKSERNLRRIIIMVVLVNRMASIGCNGIYVIYCFKLGVDKGRIMLCTVCWIHIVHIDVPYDYIAYGIPCINMLVCSRTVCLEPLRAFSYIRRAQVLTNIEPPLRATHLKQTDGRCC